MLVTNQLTEAIDFNSIEKNTMEVNGYRQLFGYQHSSKFYSELFLQVLYNVTFLLNYHTCSFMNNTIFLFMSFR